MISNKKLKHYKLCATPITIREIEISNSFILLSEEEISLELLVDPEEPTLKNFLSHLESLNFFHHVFTCFLMLILVSLTDRLDIASVILILL